MKRKPVEMLPTMVTLGNLFSGFLAIAYLTDSLGPVLADGARITFYERSIFLIFLAMVFDAVDGKVARMTGQSSAFGAQVDSICDAVSFGAAPALLFKVQSEAAPQVIAPKMALILSAIFLACAVLRLARFNLDTDDDAASHEGFEGLPTPGAAAAVAALAYANTTLDPIHADSWVREVMPWLMPLFAFLMVSRFPYLHIASLLFKRKSFPHLVFLVFLAGFVVAKFHIMIPVLCVGFALSGPVTWAWLRLTGRVSPEESVV